MSVKPSAAQLPTWDTNSTNASAITAAHKTDGYLANAVPTSGELNTLLLFHYLWIQYLSDGAFSGASSFDSSLAVTGALSTASTLGVTGAATVGGTLGVTGAATLTGGATVGANQHVNVSGTGAFKHGIKTFGISPYAFVAQGSASQIPAFTQSLKTQLRADFVCSAISIAASLELSRGLQAGQRIVNVRVYLKDVAAQPAITCNVVGGDRAGSGAVNAVNASSAASGAAQTIALTAVNHTIGTTSTGPVQLHLSTATNATGTYSVYAVEIDVDYP